MSSGSRRSVPAREPVMLAGDVTVDTVACPHGSLAGPADPGDGAYLDGRGVVHADQFTARRRRSQ
jgi:hypothetical protein